MKSHHINIWHAEGKIITQVQTIIDSHRNNDFSQVPFGPIQPNILLEQRQTFLMHKSMWSIRYSEDMCVPNHALNPRGVVVLNKTYLWSISGIQYVQCNYSAQ